MSVQPPKPHAAFLLAVWGRAYIEQWLELSLRSLLAPGNIPSMAQSYDCGFIFLTLEEDRDLFERHPLFTVLSQYCRVQFIDISDLVFGCNDSATITFAYERGMRSRGAAMCDTYFIYLVSDYVMADGSLRGLMRYLVQGYSGVTAGNFQIIEEKSESAIRNMIDPASGILAVSPRELMALSMHHLHPMTLGNMVNQTSSHCTHSNRLFWKVDEQTMIGRFYLRHMLCIRPETDNYTIGASCDYSFIPLLCPSGRVAHICDSDDYLVIEMQPLAHESHFIKPGPVDPAALAENLSEWTTAEHRANAYVPVLFHAGAKPIAADTCIRDSEHFVQKVESRLKIPPLSAHRHPYWISCMHGLLNLLAERPDQERYCRDGVYAGIFGSPVFSPVLGDNLSDYLLIGHVPEQITSWRRRLWRALMMLSGQEPYVFLWHRRWGDFRGMMRAADEHISRYPSCLFISSQRTPMANWLQGHKHARTIYQKLELFLVRPLERLRQDLSGIQLLIVNIDSTQQYLMDRLIERCLAVMPEGGVINLMVGNSQHSNADFHGVVGKLMQRCNGGRFDRASLSFITGPLHPPLNKRFFEAKRQVWLNKSRHAVAALQLALMPLLGALYCVSNMVGRFDAQGRKFHATCALVTLHVKPAVSKKEDQRQLAYG